MGGCVKQTEVAAAIGDVFVRYVYDLQRAQGLMTTVSWEDPKRPTQR